MAGTSGMDLKLARIRAGIQGKELAAAMAVTRSRVSNIEALGRPSGDAVAAYMTALDRLTAS